MTTARSAANDLDEDDLYDAVLTGSVDKEKRLPSKHTGGKKELKTADNDKSESQPVSSMFLAPPKRLGVYVGKFPWWITQEDLTKLLNALGVRDTVEIIFAENKVNGLSKGYAEIAVSSQNSMKILLDKLPKCRLGGDTLTCRFATRSNLSLFEDMNKQSVPGFPPQLECRNLNDTGSSFLSQDPFETTTPPQFFNNFANPLPTVPNPFLRYNALPLPPLPPLPLMPMFMNFMTPPSIPQTQEQHPDFAVSGTSQVGQSSSSHKDEKTEKDLEDILNRNRAVASAAINKAVSGATTGDLRNSMETLLTAISIIKQSSVSQDDRCQALVTSLKDCLMSIQGSYSYNRQIEERERDRRRSLSGERRHSSRGDSYRSRSTQRNGERSRERSRDRDRDWERKSEWNRDTDRNWDRNRNGDRNRDCDRNWDRNREGDRNRDCDRNWDRNREGDRNWDRNREGDRNWDRNRDGDRNLDRNRDGDRNWARHREGDRNWDRNRDGDRPREGDRNWDRTRDVDRSRDWERSGDGARNRDSDRNRVDDRNRDMQKDWDRNKDSDNRNWNKDWDKHRDRDRDREQHH